MAIFNPGADEPARGDLAEPDADPMNLALQWLPKASEVQPVMTLATVDVDGYPDARSVLLSDVGKGGLWFHTDSRSRKARQLEAIPRGCVVLVWPLLGRQLIARGPIRRASADESAVAFAQRSRYLQLLAWENTDERAQLSQDQRHQAWAAFAAGHPDGSLDPPDTWIGFVLDPVRFTFWSADPDGPSHRIEYQRRGTQWTMARLAG